MAGAVPAHPRRPRLRRGATVSPRSQTVRLAVRRRRGAGRDAGAPPRRRARPHEPGRRSAATASTSDATPTSTTSCALAAPTALHVRRAASWPPRTCASDGPVADACRINRLMTDGVVEAPNGAHFTECVARLRPRRGVPEGVRGERQGDPRRGTAFAGKYLDVRRSRVPGRSVRGLDERRRHRAEVLRGRRRRVLPRRRRDPRQPDRHHPDDRRPAGPRRRSSPTS